MFTVRRLVCAGLLLVFGFLSLTGCSVVSGVNEDGKNGPVGSSADTKVLVLTEKAGQSAVVRYGKTDEELDTAVTLQPHQIVKLELNYSPVHWRADGTDRSQSQQVPQGDVNGLAVILVGLVILALLALVVGALVRGY